MTWSDATLAPLGRLAGVDLFARTGCDRSTTALRDGGWREEFHAACASVRERNKRWLLGGRPDERRLAAGESDEVHASRRPVRASRSGRSGGRMAIRLSSGGPGIWREAACSWPALTWKRSNP